jgi:LAO/AO transport system kinase
MGASSSGGDPTVATCGPAEPTVLSARDLAAAVVRGDARSVARAISLLEDESPVAAELVRELFPHTGRSRVFGVTGPPGAGKSSLIACLVDEMRTGMRTGHRRLAVISVDPSSAITGGALLGDRLRLADRLRHGDIFYRSMATRGALGGLAHATLGALLVLDAAGYDDIIIETCGVGQSEIDLCELSDAVVLVLLPGAGDLVQAVKAGIMEIADVIAVNKMDNPLALATLRDVRRAETGRETRRQVIATNAMNGDGVDILLGVLESLHSAAIARGTIGQRRRDGLMKQVVRIALAQLRANLEALLAEPDVAGSLIADLADHKIDPFTAAQRLVGDSRISGRSCIVEEAMPAAATPRE